MKASCLFLCVNVCSPCYYVNVGKQYFNTRNGACRLFPLKDGAQGPEPAWQLALDHNGT